MKAESLSFGIVAIIKREKLRQYTRIDYIRGNLKAKTKLDHKNNQTLSIVSSPAKNICISGG